MESLSVEEESITKDLRNVFRLKKTQLQCSKNTRNILRKIKATKAIKDRILRDINNFFVLEKKEENSYKPD